MAGIDGFVTLYETSYGRIVREVSRLFGDVPDTEEVVQEAFARALRRWPQLRGYDAPEAWVRRVALNLALSGRVRARRQQAALTRHGLPLEEIAAELELPLGTVKSRLARARTILAAHVGP